MRIKVTGTSDVARTLRGYLGRSKNLRLVEDHPDFTVTIDISREAYIVFDSVDCELERLILNAVTELYDEDVLIRRQGGSNHSDVAIVLLVPNSESAERAIEVGAFRALEAWTAGLKTLPQKRFWQL